MATSIRSLPAEIREAPRVHLAHHRGRDVFDGGWWPRSRDLAIELASLVEHLGAGGQVIARALVSPPDWDSTPTQIRGAGGWLEVGSLPHDDTHVVLLATATTGGRNALRLLVVPPDLTPGQGEEALLAAASRGNAHSATDLLHTVTEHDDVDPRDHWT